MAARRPVPRAEGLAAIALITGADPSAPPVDRTTTRTATRWLLEELARRAPGHAVEVRVPPLAAIQAVPGPAHRRGTPAAVVEMDPTTWIELGVGSITWDQAVRAGRIRASGQRADLSTWLPLTS